MPFIFLAGGVLAYLSLREVDNAADSIGNAAVKIGLVGAAAYVGYRLYTGEGLL